MRVSSDEQRKMRQAQLAPMEMLTFDWCGEGSTIILPNSHYGLVGHFQVPPACRDPVKSKSRASSSRLWQGSYIYSLRSRRPSGFASPSGWIWDHLASGKWPKSWAALGPGQFVFITLRGHTPAKSQVFTFGDDTG